MSSKKFRHLLFIIGFGAVFLLSAASVLQNPADTKTPDTADALAGQLEESVTSREIPGYDEYKILAAEKLGYDASAVPSIKTVLAEKLHTGKNEEVTVLCLKAMPVDGSLYGVPVLVLLRGDTVFCEIPAEGSYSENWHLADIDGDGAEEILMQLCVSITGGAGAWQSDIYRLSDCSLERIFSNPERDSPASYDTYFTLHLSEGYICTIGNMCVDFQTSFPYNPAHTTPYFDEAGNLTDEGKECNRVGLPGIDPYFFLFLPVDVDRDGIAEILAAQYTYLWGRADGLGTAFTLLKWENDENEMHIKKAGFDPYPPEKETHPQDAADLRENDKWWETCLNDSGTIAKPDQKSDKNYNHQTTAETDYQ